MLWSGTFYSNFKRVQPIQDKLIRFICGYLENANATESYYNKFKVFNTGQLRDYQAGIFSHQHWNCDSPEVFHGFNRENKSYAT